jgi:hypothetical protein
VGGTLIWRPAIQKLRLVFPADLACSSPIPRSFAWALVHSRSPADVRVGLELLEALLAAEGANRRELLFLTAVGQFRQRRALEARRTLQAALVEFPDFRQADALLDACEAEVVHDGLVGVGAGAAILGVVAAVAVAALKKR